jgi:probable rRNA maturation factor
MADATDAALVTITLAGAAPLGEDPHAESGLFGLTEATIRRVVDLTLARTGITQPVELSIVVTDDAELRHLNRAYRDHDEITDVLSFPLLDAPLVRAPADQLWGAAQGEDEESAARSTQRALPVPIPERAAGAANEVRTRPHDPTSAPVNRANDDEDDETFVFRVPPDAPAHLGDIVIARGATARQAAQAGHAAHWELGYLVAHGVLHLIGYDDHTESGYAAMVSHQEAVLQQAEISRH